MSKPILSLSLLKEVCGLLPKIQVAKLLGCSRVTLDRYLDGHQPASQAVVTHINREVMAFMRQHEAKTQTAIRSPLK